VVLTLTGDNQLTLKHRHIGDILQVADMGFTADADRNRFFLEQIIHHGKVMRRQIPDHVDIVLEQAEINPDRIIVINFTQRLFVDQLLDFPDRTGKNEGMIHHDDAVFLLGQLNQLFRLRHAGGKRLLDKDMLAVFECFFGQVIMGGYRRDHRYGVNIGRTQNRIRITGDGDAGVGFAGAFGCMWIAVANGGNPAGLQIVKVAHNVGSPVAVADDAYFYHGFSCCINRLYTLLTGRVGE
jgi:hypothetical protein